MRYELYYWSGIQGRGEFVRLALEEAGADYADVARQPGGEAEMMRLMQSDAAVHPSFAPPFLKAGDLVIGQTANILLYLGEQLGLAPRDEAGRLWAHQLQLTIADCVDETHDTHHPIASSLYYEDQRAEARARSADFRRTRMPKYLGYFEKVLARNASGSGHLLGADLSYPDLSLFQLVAGLRYAFPVRMAALASQYPRVAALHDQVAARPRIDAYLASDRRLRFNEHGIFRHYPELDGTD
ncbi:MAG: glutathione S-transferase [Alphaproteobacteria bacterium]|nr:glutathione S-transferase [Alphaproteobacteria bacterium]